jgi:hypothetical protein
MKLSGLVVLFVALGVLCLGAAGVIFAMWQHLSTPRETFTGVPNTVAAGAAGGFAIAGGLCIVAAAIAHRAERHPD